MQIRVVDHQGARAETGPLQIGNDWPGCFIRGDDAFGLQMYLTHAERSLQKLHKMGIAADTDPMGLGLAGIRRLRRLLASAIQGKVGEHLRRELEKQDDTGGTSERVIVGGC